MTPTHNDLKLAITSTTLEWPYLATALWRLKLVAVNDLVAKSGGSPAAIDPHWRLYYDPEAIGSMEPCERIGLVVHELDHLLNGHTDRRCSNLACDLEINSRLNQISHTRLVLPKGAALPELFSVPERLLAEEYDQRLDKSRPAYPTEGSGVGDPKGPWELGPTGGLTELEVRLVKAQLAREITAAHKAGTVPGHWADWAHDTLQVPPTPWHVLLRRCLTRSVELRRGNVDYSYRWPHRRQSLATRILQPAMVRPVPNVAVVVDSSGSMEGTPLAIALAKTSELLKALRAPTAVYLCDTKAHSIGRINSTRRISKVLAQGGTDMGAGITEAQRARPRPDLLVVITDGWTPWPIERPPVPVIVVMTTNEPGPKWATTIHLEDPK